MARPIRSPRGADRSAIPRHVGIIPDGNRRYAKHERLSQGDAYLAATRKALEVVAWSLDAGLEHLSAFGVSQENIALRSRRDVQALHVALLEFCREARCIPGVDLHIFGDPSGLPAFVPERSDLMDLRRLPAKTDARMLVHVGVNYSSQAEMVALLSAVHEDGLDAVSQSPRDFILSARVPAVDLVIRTGGQRRLSGFLPFQSAYAELWFTDTLWPDFAYSEFLDALDWYARQERRFGE